jgi:ribosomal subunit interface protein
MALAPRVTFRDMPHSDALDAYARARAAKLDTFSERIIGCQITIESPHRRRHTGRQFRVTVDLAVPGAEIVVSHAPADRLANEDAYAAIDRAFDQAGRRLEDYARRKRGDVKSHERRYRAGIVSKLWTYEGYGFVTTSDGSEVYFHRNSVKGKAFDRLRIGTRVRFVEEMGEDGPQATMVSLLG